MINTITNLLVFIVKAFLHFIQLSDLLFIPEIHDQPDDEEADELHTGYDQQGTDIAHPSEQQRDRDKQQDDQRTVQRRSRRQRHSLDLIEGHTGKANRAVESGEKALEKHGDRTVAARHIEQLLRRKGDAARIRVSGQDRDQITDDHTDQKADPRRLYGFL